MRSVERAGALLIDDRGLGVPYPLPPGDPPAIIEVRTGQGRGLWTVRYIRTNILGLVGTPSPDGAGVLSAAVIYVLHEVGS